MRDSEIPFASQLLVLLRVNSSIRDLSWKAPAEIAHQAAGNSFLNIFHICFWPCLSLYYALVSDSGGGNYGGGNNHGGGETDFEGASMSA